MADYYSQAAGEVDSYINSGKAVNANARKQAIAEYAAYLQRLDAEGARAVGGLDAAAQTQDAQMSNRLAARGLGGSGAVQFNYGRLNAQQNATRGALMSDLTGRRADLLIGQGKAVGEINAADTALMAQRERSVAELARQLDDRAYERAMQERSMRLQEQAAAYSRSGGGGGDAYSADEEEQAFVDAYAQLAIDGATPEQLRMFAASQGRDVRDYSNIVNAQKFAPRAELSSLLDQYRPRETTRRVPYARAAYTGGWPSFGNGSNNSMNVGQAVAAGGTHGISYKNPTPNIYSGYRNY